MDNLKIDNYEGPLDLLLQLIQKKNIEICTININQIIDEYLKYIEEHKENIDESSSYLVLATKLMEIKANSLLPTPETSEEEIDEKEEFIDRLLEYKKYKEIVETFREKEEERQKIHLGETKDLSNLIDKEFIDISNKNDVNTLVEAFQKFLQRKKEEEPLITKITKKDISYEQRKIEILAKLAKGETNFLNLFDILNKEYVILTFLVILDMAKKNEINITQKNNLDQIYISMR